MIKYLIAKYTSKAAIAVVSLVSSLTIGKILTELFNTVPKEIFGITLALWVVALLVTVWDCVTGVRAYKKEKKEKGEKARFESGKGWRAIEKIFGFTVLIGFIHYLEVQMTMHEYPEYMSSGLLVIKLFFFVYGVLLELQSVGENKERLDGEKGKPFMLLDKVINFADQAIVKKIMKFFGLTEEDIKEEEGEE
jgi:steroid 5-alpha reductase family enzyme